MENKSPYSISLFKKIIDENKPMVFIFIIIGLVRLIFPPKIYQEMIVNPWNYKELYKIAPISIGNLFIEFVFILLLFFTYLFIKENKIAIFNFSKAAYQKIYFQISTFTKETANSGTNKEKVAPALPIEILKKNSQAFTNTNQMGSTESLILIKERLKKLSPKEKFIIAVGTLVFIFLAWQIGLFWHSTYQYRIGSEHQVQNRLSLATFPQ